MKLNEKLHLIVPVLDGDDRIYAYVHSAPISRETFEAHFTLISETFAEIHGSGLGVIAGPRVANLVMRRVAARSRDEKGYAALTNEIRRLTNVLVSSRGGWEMVPFQEAIDRNGAVSVDEDDLRDIENAIAFFTVVSALHRRQTLQTMLTGAAGLWGAQISSSDCTAFAASLRTSTAAESTGATNLPASSVPF